MSKNDDDLIFRPGSVVPTQNNKAFTFTLRDQFDRIWNAFDNMSSSHAYEKAYEAKAAMRSFCNVELSPT